MSINYISKIDKIVTNKEMDILHIHRYLKNIYNIELETNITNHNSIPVFGLYMDAMEAYTLESVNSLKKIVKYNSSLLNYNNDIPFELLKTKYVVYIQLKDNRRRCINCVDFISNIIYNSFIKYNDNIIFLICGTFFNSDTTLDIKKTGKYNYDINSEAYLNNITYDKIIKSVIDKYNKSGSSLVNTNIFSLINFSLDEILKYIVYTNLCVGIWTSGQLDVIQIIGNYDEIPIYTTSLLNYNNINKHITPKASCVDIGTYTITKNNINKNAYYFSVLPVQNNILAFDKDYKISDINVCTNIIMKQINEDIYKNIKPLKF